MGLTEAEQVYSGVHEKGINDLLAAFFTTRPRYLKFGSPGFVPATTVAETQMSAIPFPGVPGGIDWMVSFAIPRVDCHPETDNLPPELTLGLNLVSVHTKVEICIDCERKKPEDEEDEKNRGRAKGPCFAVEVFAIGHMEQSFGPDGEALIVMIDTIELVDIEPNEFETVIECLLLQILRAVLAQVKLPLEALRAGGFSLSLSRGPEVEDDQVKVYGSIT